jgi:3-methyl-2-oxobutanoate hydroxymethyltransferase
VANLIREKLEIPTIGIGAGVHCDGQVLVIQDLLGMFRKLRPRFVKTYLDGGDILVAAVRAYIDEVKSGAFPTAQHSFPVDDKILKEL